jgi:nitrogen fixation NifU-like protein
MIPRVYAAAFLDHFQNPRGQGALPDATHAARREDPACGDVLELDLRVVNGAVADARFRVRGCAGAIAVGSALVTLLRGREARPDAVSREELESELGEVPATKRHALRLGVETLASALDAPLR